MACSATRAAEGAGGFSKATIDLGLVASDAGRTAQFLTNAIGFKEIRGFSVTPEMGRKIGLVDGHPVDVRVFVLGDGESATRIKVLSFPNAPGKQPDQKFIHTTLGVRYLTLYVKDMGKALERLKKSNVALVAESPVQLGGTTQLTVVRDPDGNFFELVGPAQE
jgi:catechol 2,3-dioxygenase-like lactoylglutathione lyase family enzyme